MSDEKIKVAIPEKVGNSVMSTEVATMIANAVAEALRQAIPAAAVGINAANAQSENKKRETAVREAMAKVQRCPICLLPVSACGGAFKKDDSGNDIIKRTTSGDIEYVPSENHLLFYCGPRDESLFAWFQGVTIKGVRFLSDSYGHQIWIPKKSDIPTIINNWERNERELSRARKAEGRGIPANGQSQQALGWR